MVMSQFGDQAAANKRRVGEATVTSLSDGYVDVGPEFLQGMPEAEIRDLTTSAAGPSPLRVQINAFLVEIDGRRILIDTGSGASLGPTAGRLFESLEREGVEPVSVDSVLLTHIHPDHSNGLTDSAGRALFPNAEVLVHANELAHWLDDERMARASQRERERYFEPARRQLRPYEDRLRSFRQGEIATGIRSVPLPGHTPGHTGYLIESAGERLLVWADTVHIEKVQVPHPDVTIAADIDAAAAVASRKRIFALAAEERIPIAGMHLQRPGFAALTKEHGRYRLLGPGAEA